MKSLKTIIVTLFAGIAGGLAGTLVMLMFAPEYFFPSLPQASPPLFFSSARRGENNLAIAEAARSSVDFVRFKGADRWLSFQESAGRGVVLTSDGLILTAAPKIDAEKLTGNLLSFSDRRIFKLSLVTLKDELSPAFRERNVRLLRAVSGGEPFSFRPVTLALFESIHPGDEVFSFTPERTIRISRVSALRALKDGGLPISADSLPPLIWLDNSPEPDSPVFDRRGYLIGISTADGGIIPADFFGAMLKQFLQEGRYTPAVFGIRYIDLNASVVADKDLPPAGLLLQKTNRAPAVRPDSPAARSGLKEGDVLIAFDGHRMNGGLPFSILLQRYRPGAEVEIIVLRDGQEHKLKVAL